ncbi:RHS repeat-associated core domain-containing protein [Hymenobacter daecheongensis DSM 21074]|uniref:RHS repeat-associated core domain-containing protein n=1 Tax=Hymenobacter daecheongensis DSM 21074 TaxID=1121955 RepID=A0A1M6MPL5_9BACT|nr:hypothetical protein [Hymenobacter daecheongensis]SHJ85233.1 RHS repeat-associated core domain-containing protein [Hymenobacter daecheongensis DSM 21074]
MRYLYAFSLLLALGLGRPVHAQQPFERYGVKVKVATLSNGRFQEFFTNDSLRRIGSVVYDTRLRRVAYLLPPDSLVGHAKPDITSRWMSPDPLAEKFMYISPYAYGNNNPVRYMDPDGREIIDTKGNPVSVHINKNGSVTLGSNATADTRRVVKAMAMTPTGRARIDAINKSDIGIIFYVNDKEAPTGKKIVLGSTTPPRDPNSGIEGKEQKAISIYTDNIEKATAGETKDKTLKGLTMEQAIGAVASHESVHGVDKQQIALETSKPTPTETVREKKPDAVESQVANDIRKGRR